MKVCLILSGGTVTGSEYVPTDYDYVVSADGGYLNALRCNLKPNVCIGDFDTLTVGVDPSCEVLRYPPEKDDTDTMLCVKKAISMGYDCVYLYGATGGRLDHSVANLQCLEYAALHGVLGYVVDAQNVATVQVVSTRRYPKREGFRYFSILALSESATVSASGLRYPLDGTTLNRSFPLGVSNELLPDTDYAEVSVHGGTVLVVYSKD